MLTAIGPGSPVRATAALLSLNGGSSAHNLKGVLMRIATVAIVTAVVAAAAWGAYAYEGGWGTLGGGNGEFNQPYGVACAPTATCT